MPIRARDPEGFARESHRCFWIKVFKRVRIATRLFARISLQFPGTEKEREKEKGRGRRREVGEKAEGMPDRRCAVVAQRSEYLDRSGAPGE